MLKNKDNQFAWRFIRCKKGMFSIKESQFKNVYNNATYISLASCINACIISVYQIIKNNCPLLKHLFKLFKN